MKLFKILSLLCLFASSELVKSCPEDQEQSFYVGADAQYCKMCFKGPNGKGVFSNKNHGASLFGGIFLTDSVSFELGYQRLESSKTAMVRTGDNFFGIPFPAVMSPSIFHAKYSIQGPYLDMIFHTPIIEGMSTSFFAGVGLSRTSAKFERNLIKISMLHTAISSNFRSKKTLYRSTVGFKHFISDQFFIKGNALLFSSGKLDSFKTHGNVGITNPNVVPKNSICFGLGLGYHF